MSSYLAAGFTANDFRDLARKQNQIFVPTNPVPHFKDFPAAKATLILTCMDPRVQPHEFWDLKDKPFGIVRNAGGRAQEFLKSAEWLGAGMSSGKGSLGTVAVVHHTDCGYTNCTERFIKDQIKSRHPELTPGQLRELEEREYGEIHDIDASVREAVILIRNDPFLPNDLEVVGFVLDEFTGKTREVVANDHTG